MNWTELQFNRFVLQIYLGFVLVEFFFSELNQNSYSGIFLSKIFNCELKENKVHSCF